MRCSKEDACSKFVRRPYSRLRCDITTDCYVFFDKLMGEGFILLTRGYGFMGGMYHPIFDTLKIGTSTDDMKLKLYR